MDSRHRTGGEGYWPALLCRLLLIAITGAVLAVAMLGSSFPGAAVAALLLLCLAVCLLLWLQSGGTEAAIRRAVEEETRRRGGTRAGG